MICKFRTDTFKREEITLGGSGKTETYHEEYPKCYLSECPHYRPKRIGFLWLKKHTRLGKCNRKH